MLGVSICLCFNYFKWAISYQVEQEVRFSAICIDYSLNGAWGILATSIRPLFEHQVIEIVQTSSFVNSQYWIYGLGKKVE